MVFVLLNVVFPYKVDASRDAENFKTSTLLVNILVNFIKK